MSPDDLRQDKEYAYCTTSHTVKFTQPCSWECALPSFLSKITIRAPGTLTRVLWGKKPWVYISPISMWEWTPWPTYCITHTNCQLLRDRWSTCCSENCQLASTPSWPSCATWAKSRGQCHYEHFSCWKRFFTSVFFHLYKDAESKHIGDH
jgi:hypothetical protein